MIRWSDEDHWLISYIMLYRHRFQIFSRCFNFQLRNSLIFVPIDCHSTRCSSFRDERNCESLEFCKRLHDSSSCFRRFLLINDWIFHPKFCKNSILWLFCKLENLFLKLKFQISAPKCLLRWYLLVSLWIRTDSIPLAKHSLCCHMLDATYLSVSVDAHWVDTWIALIVLKWPLQLHFYINLMHRQSNDFWCRRVKQTFVVIVRILHTRPSCFARHCRRKVRNEFIVGIFQQWSN